MYGELDLRTRKFGTALFASTDGMIDTLKPVMTPRKFLQRLTLPDDGRRTSLALNIDEATKEIIEKHTERDIIDFDVLMTGAFAYYGLLATHLYSGEDIYIKTFLPRRLEQMVLFD